jgi:hypothetical protein
MNDISIEEWLKVEKLKLTVKEDYYHHHAYEIINGHSSFKKSFLNKLENTINVKTIKRKKKDSRGIGAKELNIELRSLLKELDNIKFEVNEVDGIFHFSQKNSETSGFDFAILDHYRNLVNLRNRCFGSYTYHDGEKRWKKFLDKNLDLKDKADVIMKSGVTGNNIFLPNDHSSLIILGEIQFGNWALAYRDIFKVLKANVHNTVDCLIYIVPTGNLQNALSDGIVTFDYLKEKVLQSFEKVVSVPVWVVGLDFEFC